MTALICGSLAYDTVMVFDSAVQGASRFDGGGGQQDSLVLVGSLFASPPKIAGFESVLSP